MKKIILILFLFIVLFSVKSYSQDNIIKDYCSGIGVKLNPFAVSGKLFVSDERAIELQCNMFSTDPRVVGLYEVYQPILGPLVGYRLQWYYGAGVHYKLCSNVPGADGVIGIDYKLKNSPVDISLDLQPNFDFKVPSQLTGFGGMSIRYTIKWASETLHIYST